MHEYSSQLNPIILKEYGRNIQRIATKVSETADEAEKAKLTKSLVELMKQINPTRKDNEDYDQTVWNNLYHVIGPDFKIEDAPFSRPEVEQLAPPEQVPYDQGNIRYMHYGKNVQNLVKKAASLTGEDKENATLELARIMYRFYTTWNRENVDPEVIKKNIAQLSENQLDLDIEKAKELNLFVAPKETFTPTHSQSRSHSKNKRKRRRN